MKINNLMSLVLILSGFTIANSSHAMLMRHTMNRSGTKYAAQWAQNTQKRFIETESKKVSQMSSMEGQKTSDELHKKLENLEKTLTANNQEMKRLTDNSFGKTVERAADDTATCVFVCGVVVFFVPFYISSLLSDRFDEWKLEKRK